MPFCRECQREMPAEIVQTPGAVCQACGRAEERVRRRRRDALYCSEACRHHAWRRRVRAMAMAKAEARRKIEDLGASLIG
jgi:hypothetical protein